MNAASRRSTCRREPVAEPQLTRSLLAERHHAEWFVAEGTVPGVEVHRDRDVTWIVHPGEFWRNAGILVRFTPASAARRLDMMIERYRAHGRGMAVWVGPATTPGNLNELLKARGLRCQKYYPAMVRSLSDVSTIEARPAAGLVIRASMTSTSEDSASVDRPGHDSAETTGPRAPAIVDCGSCQANAGLRRMARWTARRRLRGGSTAAGLHSLSVPTENRGRGIGRALLRHACEQARIRNAATIVLLASTEGQQLYSRCGFSEVARFGYGSQSFQRHRGFAKWLAEHPPLDRGGPKVRDG